MIHFTKKLSLRNTDVVIYRKWSLIILTIVMIVGFSTSIYLYMLDKYSLLYYGDAVSHLVRAREFVDSARPGLLEQIGTGWLPLPHLLIVPTALVNPLFKSGFAGTAISLPCFAITSVLTYRIIKAQININYIAVTGTLLYALNWNIIYLGIVPMTEAPFMLFFVASAYYLQKWYLNSDNHYYLDPIKCNSIRSLYLPIQLIDLLKCSFFISLATLCRYEAWIIPIFMVIFVLLSIVRRNEVTNYGIKFKALAILVSVLSFSGIVLWISYNAYYYGDPLRFSNAVYWSAAYQAIVGTNRIHLYLQPLNVAAIYTVTAVAIYGPVLLIAGIIGYVLQRRYDSKETKRNKNIVLCIFFSLPPTVTVLSMVLGIAEMNQQWFNSRFLILLSPLIVLSVSILIARLPKRIKKSHFYLLSTIGILFVYQFVTPALGFVVTFLEARHFISSGTRPFSIKAAEALTSKYNGGRVLIITGSAQQNNIIQQSGIPLRNFDTILEGDTWNPSFKKPWLYNKYIIISKEADPSAANVSRYWLHRQQQLSKYFDIVYENKYYTIMTHKQNPTPICCILYR
ncbi:MAG TPA: hypothetical protein VEL11_02150 [Candidatus Bathyarchaeia archaeon]|nr:hypothetical protein [Candidatus Bathyarchaeia archaeon]